MHRLGIGCLFSVVGIFLTSVTEWTYRQTPILFTFHVIMGCLASLYYEKRLRARAKKERAQIEIEDLEAVGTTVEQR
jgi:hypothetical protein